LLLLVLILLVTLIILVLIVASCLLLTLLGSQLRKSFLTSELVCSLLFGHLRIRLHVDGNDKCSKGVSSDNSAIVHDVLRCHLNVFTVGVSKVLSSLRIGSRAIDKLRSG